MGWWMGLGSRMPPRALFEHGGAEMGRWRVLGVEIDPSRYLGSGGAWWRVLGSGGRCWRGLGVETNPPPSIEERRSRGGWDGMVVGLGVQNDPLALCWGAEGGGGGWMEAGGVKYDPS